MKKIIVILLSATLLIGCSKEKTEEIIEMPNGNIENEIELVEAIDEVEFNQEIMGGSLKGLLSNPSDETETVGLIVPETALVDKDGYGNGYIMLAKELNDNHIACLRYDQRGVGESSNIEVDEKMGRDEYVNDVVGYIEKLREEGGFKNIYLIGHGEGSLIAGLAADKIVVEGVISLGGNGENIKEVFSFLRDISEVLLIQGTNDSEVSVDEAKELDSVNPDSKLVIIEDMGHALKNAASPENSQEHKGSYIDESLPLNEELVKEIILFMK